MTDPGYAEIEVHTRTLAEMMVHGMAVLRDDGSFQLTPKGDAWMKAWTREKLADQAAQMKAAFVRLKDALDKNLPPEVWNHELKADFGLVRNWAEIHAQRYERKENASGEGRDKVGT